MMLGSKYRLGFAVFATFVGMAALAPAKADMIEYSLIVGNSGVPGPAPYGTITIDLLSSTEALITFNSNTSLGYYFTDGGSVAVNANGTATISNITGNQTGNAGCTGNGCYSDGGAGNEDGFGSFSNSVNTMGSFQNRSSMISFDLTDTSGTWASASAVLTDNSTPPGEQFAAHIGTCTDANCSGGFAFTGFAASGGPTPTLFNVSVPEPASVAIFGTALLALGGLSLLRRRRREYEA